MLIHHTIELAKFKSKRLLEQSPGLFVWIAEQYNKVLGHSTDRIVSKDSDICIEGFPRCANSFAYAVFRNYQPESLSIATHIHSAAQIIKAVSLDVPTLVLIRNPEACVVSLRALRKEAAVRENKHYFHWHIQHEIRWYINFYKQLMPYKGKFVLARFDEVVTDFGAVIKRINQQLGTSFADFEHTPENRDQIFSTSNYHLSPSDKRKEFKEEFKAQYMAPENQYLIQKAEAIYQNMIA
ncbi:MAG: sulfotransferase domain-containing protein [Bacteroidota bacterium]